MVNKTNTFAILSLIFAFFFFPLGLIFGIMALSQIKQSKEEGKGLAIAGIVVSCLPLVLIFLVLGFVVPGMFYSDPSSAPQIEPRVCQNDDECYLMCNEEPLKVLCSYHLCQQNSCTEITSYPFNESISFQLHIKVNGETLNLNSRSLPGNMFITFNSDNVNIISPHILLSQVLDKVHITMSADCLVFDGNNYCRDESHNLIMKVNGEQSYSYQAYLPENGDKVEIVYS